MKTVKSRTVWTLVIAFAYNGFAAISGTFDPNVTVIVNAVLSLLAGYFKMNPSQEY